MNLMQEKNLEIRKSLSSSLGGTVVKALEANGFKALYVATAAEAVKAVLDLVPKGSSVGVPGTSTIRELGLPGELESRGCKIFQHWDPSLAPEDRPKRWEDEIASDVYLTSSNGVTMDGMLVNIDGTGNRVAGMAWAKKRIIFVVGINKVSRDVQSSLQRIRDVATPVNALRLGMDLPCTKVGHCVDCKSPQRACRAVLILERAPFGRDAHVIIVGENLGY
ncbi:MAG: lactate utilization protein [Thermovirgaceae bacterium]|nr:lactate utilization protein [Thermovirgaceae bacterium]